MSTFMVQMSSFSSKDGDWRKGGRIVPSKSVKDANGILKDFTPGVLEEEKLWSMCMLWQLFDVVLADALMLYIL